MGIFQEFKTFAMKGNVVDLAVGVIIGAAFGKIVTALVEQILMPPIGWMVGDVDFTQLRWILRGANAENPEVAVGYGVFIQAVVQFMIVAWALFLVIKAMNRMRVKNSNTPAAPAPPTEEVILLREIRDSLKSQSPR